MNPKEVLTPGEHKVWELRAAGMRNKDVAVQLKITKDNAAVLYSLARRRMAGEIMPAAHHPDHGDLSAQRAKRERERAREFRAAKSCGRCSLRGEHVCLKGDAGRRQAWL